MCLDDDLFDYSEATQVASPCVNVCAIDPVTTWCIGCGRSGDEIQEWFDAGDRRRRSILSALPERMELLRTR